MFLNVTSIHASVVFNHHYIVPHTFLFTFSRMSTPDDPFNFEGEQAVDQLTPVLLATDNHQLHDGEGQDEDKYRPVIAN